MRPTFPQKLMRVAYSFDRCLIDMAEECRVTPESTAGMDTAGASLP